jgi:hypothetical protein
MGLDAFARIPSRYGMRVCQQNQREQVRAGAYYGYIVFVYLMRFSPGTVGRKPYVTAFFGTGPNSWKPKIWPLEA